jgi:hypothetical protein
VLAQLDHPPNSTGIQNSCAASTHTRHLTPNLTTHNRQATGASVLSELQGQREAIRRAQATLDDASAELKGGEGVIKTMMRRTKWFFG